MSLEGCSRSTPCPFTCSLLLSKKMVTNLSRSIPGLQGPSSTVAINIIFKRMTISHNHSRTSGYEAHYVALAFAIEGCGPGNAATLGSFNCVAHNFPPPLPSRPQPSVAPTSRGRRMKQRCKAAIGVVGILSVAWRKLQTLRMTKVAETRLCSCHVGENPTATTFYA